MAVAGVNRPTALRLPDTDISARRIRHVGRQVGDQRLIAVLLSVALHALVPGLIPDPGLRPIDREDLPGAKEQILHLALVTPPAQDAAPGLVQQRAAPLPQVAAAAHGLVASSVGSAAPPAPAREPASMAPPPPPTAQEWAFASRYTLRNSKGYRHSWGQQVRSMMGTAVEGPDQGVVRFQIEIAPDGTMTRLETLWTTSAAAERRAREAIARMPPLPPTPTGKVLVFERTISFSPFVSDVAPIYKDDCLPEPPAFRNPFVWGGQGASPEAGAAPDATTDVLPLEECLKQLPQDSIEAEAAHDQRQLRQWRSGTLGR